MQQYITFVFTSGILFFKPDMLRRLYKQQYLKVTPGQSVQQHSLWKVRQGKEKEKRKKKIFLDFNSVALED